MNFSISEENYLKTIFTLQLDQGKVTTNMLAEKLKARPASITDMMKKLSAKNMVVYKPYYGFHLSTEGKKVAISVIRRHRLWEFFLSQKLNFGWDEVHLIAEELEHVSSKKLIDKLDDFLDFPEFDPHGDPIPDSKGKIKLADTLTLYQLPVNQPARVTRVINQSVEMLDLLQNKNISIGSKIEVKKHFAFDGSLTVKIQPNKTETLSEQLAKNLLVKKI
ncbi:MAG TPA: metal-dependent transcriptional regulator [Chitinophagaceae bacterium]|nr:metal-dependent transcriptional regulator [Chitinophagaceae bacterium]